MLSVFLSKDKICTMEKSQGRLVHVACRSNPCPSVCGQHPKLMWLQPCCLHTLCFDLFGGKKAARALWLAGCGGNMELQAI